MCCYYGTSNTHYSFILSICRNIAGPASRKKTYWMTTLLFAPDDYCQNEEDAKYGRLYRDVKGLVENGITFKDGDRWNVRVFTLSGDLLELNGHVGLSTAFGAGHYVDRFTYMSKADRLNARSLEDIDEARTLRRNKAEVRKDYEALESGDKVGARGVVRRPLLDMIPHYDPLEFGSTSSCLGHDVLAGCLKEDLALIMRLLVMKGLVSWDDLSRMVNEFRKKLSGADNTSYPGTVKLRPSKNFKLQGNMLQMATLARFLPLILHGELIINHLLSRKQMCRC